MKRAYVLKVSKRLALVQPYFDDQKRVANLLGRLADFRSESPPTKGAIDQAAFLLVKLLHEDMPSLIAEVMEEHPLWKNGDEQ